MNQLPTSQPNDDQIQVLAAIAHKNASLGIQAEWTPPITSGPAVTCFRFVPKGSTKVAHLENLASDYALATQTEDVVVKRMPGENSVGIFVPNKTRTHVDFKTSVGYVMKRLSEPNPPKIPLNFGIDFHGNPFIEDLVPLPHLLIAGTTGGGKSVLLNGLATTIVHCMNSREVKLIISDTKQVEFTAFTGVPHLMFDVAKSIYSSLEQLDWAIEEMDSRMKTLARSGVKNIAEYNESVDPSGQERTRRMPYIVLMIDEIANLLSFKGEKRGESKLAQDKIQKIVSLARAAGLHMIAATQRTSVDAVKGIIKANFPARLSFRLPSGVDSRTILDTEGAEHLLSQGDMLYISSTRAGLQRLHAPFVRTTDIKATIEYAVMREEYGELEKR